MMKKEKKHLTERILNHALGIIYLLTGEEYVIVKKNSPHSATDLLTGEVPIKCGDFSIYFSMEEWDFVEEHKDLYQEVALKNQKIFQPPGTFEDTNIDGHTFFDTVSLVEEELNEKRMSIHHVDTCTDIFMDKLNAASHSAKEHWETNENDILQVEIDSDTYSGKYYPNHVLDDDEPAEELFARPCGKEICGDTWLEHPLPTDDSIDGNILKGPYNVTRSSDNSAEEDVSYFHGLEGEISPDKPLSFEIGNLTYTSVSEECEQRTPLLNESIDSIAHEELERNKPVKTPNVRKCPKRPSRSSPRAIEQTVHVEERSHRCDDCGKFFDYKSNLIRHQRSHTGEKPYACDECGKRYATKSHLTIHKRTHLCGKPHRCDECGKHFTYKSQIAMHQRTHTGEKPHTCNLCGKNFAYKSYLIIHQRIHSGERPHVCPQCGKCFTDKSNLRKHQNTHVENKPYVCKECGKHFITKYSLTTHQRTHLAKKCK